MSVQLGGDLYIKLTKRNIFLAGAKLSSRLWNASEVCACVQRQVPILALTATASPATVGKIEMALALAMANTIQIVRSPDRENIKLVLQAYGKDDGDHKRYVAVLEDLLAKGEKAKRLIVY